MGCMGTIIFAGLCAWMAMVQNSVAALQVAVAERTASINVLEAKSVSAEKRLERMEQKLDLLLERSR